MIDSDMYTLNRKARLLFPPPIILALFLSFDLAVSWPRAIHLPEITEVSIKTWLAVAVLIFSIFIMLISLLQLLFNKTTFNALHADHTSKLVTNGCFKYSRNPVYLGFACVQLSIATILDTNVGVLTTPLLVVFITQLHIKNEEAAMHKIFGDEWIRYKNKTKRWLNTPVFL